MEFKVISTSGKRFHIKARRSNIHWKDDPVSIYDYAKCESDEDEYVVNWIPEYLLTALDQPNYKKAAIVAIGDYFAGWHML